MDAPVLRARRRSIAAGAATLAAVLLLSACATAPAPPALAPAERLDAWERHLRRLDALVGWALAGRFAARDAGDSWSGGLRWSQRGAVYRIRLSGPLGQGLVELRGDGDTVELRTADGSVKRAASAGPLLAAEAGWSMPLAGLRYWVLGRPRPDTAVAGIELDPAGRLGALDQDGWEIRYREYAEQSGIALPVDVELAAGARHARLRVRRWALAGPGG